MSSDAPASPLYPDCREPLKLVKTMPHVGGLPEIHVFYCSRCKQAETRGGAGTSCVNLYARFVPEVSD